MRVIAFKSPKGEVEKRLIHEMYRLCARMFSGLRARKVGFGFGVQADTFDGVNTAYLSYRDPTDAAVGCALPVSVEGGSRMRNVFPQRLSAGHRSTPRRIIESSRSCVDTRAIADWEQGGLHLAIFLMSAEIAEWRIRSGYREIGMATDLRLDGIFRRAGWPFIRMWRPSQINETGSIAGVVRADRQSFDPLRPNSHSSHFVRLEEKAV
ncbi:acyl-homoserine-lactone synthase [Rhizobium sp. 18065]|uniref:acyl-homoserine-lactone synthase n=1 Tax=Rhizobium sp. 18065 TaxID=2681411 RepID=UPI00135BCE0D|nr:acyl-homoserine-lactone synthase [Rhizobium sp. 18065]